MPIRSAIPPTTVPTATSPSSNRGRMTLSMTHRTAKLDATVHSANTDAPATAIVNTRGWSRTIEMIRFSPRRARSNRGVEVGESTPIVYQRPIVSQKCRP